MDEQSVLERLGFVILCPDRQWGGLRTSVQSIKDNLPSAQSVCVVGDDTSHEEMEEFNSVVPTIVGGNTITGLINRGLTAISSEWNFIFVAGNYVRESLLRRYARSIKNEHTIVYPVVNRRWVFDQASINGLLLSRRAFQEIGHLAEHEEDISLVKLFWGLDAVDRGYHFHALVGARM